MSEHPTTFGSALWQPSSNMNPVPDVEAATILLGTQMVPVSVLVVAIVKEVLAIPLGPMEQAILRKIVRHKKPLYHLVRQRCQSQSSTISISMVCKYLKQCDRDLYGVLGQSNSSTHTTPPPPMEENISPVTKRVILINQDKRKQNTSTKVVPETSSQSLSASQQLSNDW